MFSYTRRKSQLLFQTPSKKTPLNLNLDKINVYIFWSFNKVFRKSINFYD